MALWEDVIRAGNYSDLWDHGKRATGFIEWVLQTHKLSENRKHGILTTMMEANETYQQYDILECAYLLRNYQAILKLAIDRLHDLDCLLCLLCKTDEWGTGEIIVNMIVDKCIACGNVNIGLILRKRDPKTIVLLCTLLSYRVNLTTEFMKDIIMANRCSIPLLQMCGTMCEELWESIISGEADTEPLMAGYNLVSLLKIKIPLSTDAYYNRALKSSSITEHELFVLFFKAGSERPREILHGMPPIIIQKCMKLWDIPFGGLLYLLDDERNTKYLHEYPDYNICYREQAYTRLNLIELAKLEYTWRIPRDIINMVRKYC
jgi:hypothetical protein